jgi:hypothetical protein
MHQIGGYCSYFIIRTFADFSIYHFSEERGTLAKLLSLPELLPLVQKIRGATKYSGWSRVLLHRFPLVREQRVYLSRQRKLGKCLVSTLVCHLVKKKKIGKHFE